MVKNKNKNKTAKKKGKTFPQPGVNPRPPTCKVISSSTVPRHQMLNGGGRGGLQYYNSTLALTLDHIPHLLNKGSTLLLPVVPLFVATT